MQSNGKHLMAKIPFVTAQLRFGDQTQKAEYPLSMPISEEVLGVLVGQQSSDSFAGVPIKKRRFPIVRSPSPPPQIPSSLPQEVNGLQSEQSISGPEPSSMSVSSASVTTKDYSLEDAGSYSGDGNLKLMLGNERYLELSLQQTIVTTDSSETLSEGNKSTSDNSLGSHRVSENSSLLSAYKDPSVEGKIMKTDNSALEKVSGNTELQLGFREAAGVPGEVQNSGRSSWEQQKLHQVTSMVREKSFVAKEKLRGLALANEKNNVQQTNANCNPLLSERSQWDLNTTMETWDGSSSHSDTHRQATGTDGLDLGGPCEQKPVIFPSGMIHKEQMSNFSEHPSGNNKNSIKPFSSATLPDEGYDFKAGLLKQLNPPHSFPSCFDQHTAGKSDAVRSKLKTSCLHASGQPTLVTANINSFHSKSVKSEPVEVGCPVGCKRVDGCSENLVDQRIPKLEPFYEVAQVSNTTEHSIGVKSVESRTVKSEISEVSRQISPKVVAGPSEMQANQETTLGISKNVVKTSEMDSMSVCSDVKESVVAEQAVNAAQMTFSEGINPESSKSMLDGPRVLPSPVNDKAAEGDEDGKIENSADIQVDDPSNQNQENVLGKQQNDEYDYEDGEVREPLPHDTVDTTCATNDTGNADGGHSDHKENGASGIHRDDSPTSSSQPEHAVSKTDFPCETTTDQCAGDCDIPPSSEMKDQGSSEAPSTEASTVVTGKKRTVKATRKVPRGCSKGIETASDQAAENQVTITEGDQHESNEQREKVKVHNAEDGHSNSHKKLSSVTSEEVNKDVYNKGHRSRIINLTRTDDRSSSERTKPTAGRSSSHCFRKEKQPVRSEKHPRGTRNEICTDGLRKFERERNEHRSVGKTESDYLLVRGRVDKSLDALGGGRDSDRDYASERYQGTTDFRFHRHKKPAAFTAGKLECDSFVAPDGTVSNAARAGGRPKNDDVQGFRHLPLRRRSPGGRDGPMSLGMQMVHMPLRETSPNRCITGNAPDMVLFRQTGGREAAMALGMQIPRRSLRDISPERRIGGDGPDLVVLKHEEKYIRGFPDMMDPLFTRRQPHFQHLDNPFVRRERSLSPLQRRHSLRMPRGSKSPRRSHSPCQWSPHRRRSPAEFEGRVELLHGRPPPLLRMERMRPPQNRPCFAEDMMGRRRDSPPYIARLSNEIRDVGPSREHDHHLMIHRSPSGRVSRRSSRRLDMMDPRERTEGDEYFVPHPGRVHELVDDGCVDERRKCSEGRGLHRPFRPPHDVGANAEAFPYHGEDGSRPHRIRPEDDAEFRERAAPRDFDRHIKYRLGNPRIPRGIDQGENYGHEYLNGVNWTFGTSGYCNRLFKLVTIVFYLVHFFDGYGTEASMTVRLENAWHFASSVVFVWVGQLFGSMDLSGSKLSRCLYILFLKISVDYSSIEMLMISLLLSLGPHAQMRVNQTRRESVASQQLQKPDDPNFLVTP
ncbi:hypothetical protein ACLOJK_041937 [Asimina triloba]